MRKFLLALLLLLVCLGAVTNGQTCFRFYSGSLAQRNTNCQSSDVYFATDNSHLYICTVSGAPGTWTDFGNGGGGSGSVTSVSVATANGFAGTVANPTTTPAITVQTSITGVLKGNGTAISAATAGTDYSTPSSTDTLTNKTYDTAGTGNSFSINGVAATANTGTGSVVRATSPTLVTPTIGAATATSINGLGITSTTGTLTVTSGTHTLPANTGTVAELNLAQTFTALPTSQVQAAGGTSLCTNNTTAVTGTFCLSTFGAGVNTGFGGIGYNYHWNSGGNFTRPNTSQAGINLFFDASGATDLAAFAYITSGGTATQPIAIDMTVGNYRTITTGQYAWTNSSTNARTGTVDTGIARNAAGLVEFNNGTLGTFADWTARASTLSSATAPITFSNAAYHSCTALTTNSSGVLGCTASDERLKQGFGNFNNGLAVIKKITPQTYRWKANTSYADGDKVHLGLIAQDLQRANPLLVSATGAGVLGPEPMALHAVEIDAIKTLDAKIEALTKIVAAQEKEIARLRSERAAAK